jgi:hypothetical protein
MATARFHTPHASRSLFVLPVDGAYDPTVHSLSNRSKHDAASQVDVASIRVPTSPHCPARLAERGIGSVEASVTNELREVTVTLRPAFILAYAHCQIRPACYRT